ncbi:hypothetical protein [Cloacibacterium sp.]|uniref:hypothetical protein n=1 Tax=Cloacibacterium sp. TaxID=1913682 RepID=UPI0039E638FE
MKKTLFSLFIFISAFVWSQLSYEKGYFIDNENQKHEVLIKNIDWLENPKSFKYKETESGEEKTADTKTVKEFQVFGYNKLVRYTGKIENSSYNINNLSNTEEPSWEEKEVFLYVASSGLKTLYYYFENANDYRFFYSDEDGIIKPLIYKIYNPDGDETKVAKNKTYISQLKKIFSNNNEVIKLLNITDYNKEKLKKVFDLHNGITNIKQTNKSKIFLNIRPGLTLNNLKIDNKNIELKYPSQVSFRFGIELEYILSFNRNKWALIFEPTYYNYNSNTQKLTSNSRNSDFEGSVKYSRIEFPIGFRHYMFLNKNSKIFINGLLTFNHVIKPAKIEYSNMELTSLTPNKSGLFFNIGAGYNYKNKYQLEIRYAKKNILDNYVYWDSNYNIFSFILGYNIF